jgi:hypothetical protein
MPKINKNSKFNRGFAEPCEFSNGQFCLSAELYDKDTAFAKIVEYMGGSKEEWEEHWDSPITNGFIRFGFPPEDVRDSTGDDEVCWYIVDSAGRGAKPVWVIGDPE